MTSVQGVGGFSVPAVGTGGCLLTGVYQYSAADICVSDHLMGVTSLYACCGYRGVSTEWVT